MSDAARPLATRGCPRSWGAWSGLRSMTVVALVALCATTATSLPPSLRSEGDLEQASELFMSNAVAGDLGAAYRAIAPYRPRRAQVPLDDVESRRQSIRKRLGLSLGFERLAAERVGARLVRTTYLERFDSGALVWRFLFYRADASWQLMSLERSEDLGDLFRGD